MKLSQTLFLSALIATFLSWHDPGQVSGGGPAGNPNLPSATNSNHPSTLNPNPPVVPSPNKSVVPSPNTPVTSNTQPVDFPLSMPVAVVMAFLLSIFWQKFGIDSRVVKGETPSSVLKNLIREVEESSGYTRNDARAKAKAWLVGNVTSLGDNEILLAKTHFSYLLPSEWGLRQNSGTNHSLS